MKHTHLTPEQNHKDNGLRFTFGANWIHFLSVLDDDRIQEAERSLREMLQIESLDGKSFLDIGSGSGLFSLAARRLGAKVYSFDFDSQSVSCATELRRRYFPNDVDWKIQQGSALDCAYMNSLGTFDVVYSWGVLHHTGAMWLGIENTIARVAPTGQLFIAIYNDQGFKSHVWWFIKWFYNRLPFPLNKIYAYCLGFIFTLLNIIKYTILLKPSLAISPLLHYKNKRGMSLTHDLIDWIGGFPYEFATYDLLLRFLECRGFNLIKGISATSLGCHELVFRQNIKQSYS